MRDELTKKYTNGELTVVWKPQLCSHSTNCWRGIGGVFKPKERPWIDMTGASTAEIEMQVSKCPSGALTSFKGTANAKAQSSAADSQPQSAATVKVSPDGPLVMTGEVIVEHTDGHPERRERSVAFCRCGQSSNKPFCDGSHKKIGFKG